MPRLGSLLFPARGYTDKPFVSFGVRKIALDTCGVKGFTHHDIRRTFATNMARLGVRLEVTEKLLNHVSGSLGGIVGVYQRHDFKRRNARSRRQMGIPSLDDRMTRAEPTSATSGLTQ